MNPPPGLLGNAIKKARKDKKLTQMQLAELLLISVNYVKQLESERRNPSVIVLYRLVNILNMSLDTVFFDINDESLEIKSKIDLALSHCDVHELEVAYATIEAMIKKE